MNRDRLTKRLVADEGFVPHAYRDSLGHWTIGIGRLVDERLGGGITRQEAELLLDNDIRRCEADLDRATPWWRDTLNAARQEALVNMCFQLGISRLLGFLRMLAALERRNWAAAKDEALDSKWAIQSPARARRVAQVFATGTWEGVA